MTVITESNFEKTLEDAHVVMVDFWAAWCGPCRMLSPIVDEIDSQWAGKVVVAKCNVDECSEIAMRYGIMSIPTLLFFRDGSLVGKSVGLVGKKEIEKRLSEIIQA